MLLNCLSRSFYRARCRLSISVLASMFSSRTLEPDPTESLLRRVGMIIDPKASILPVLEDWNTNISPISYKQGILLIDRMKSCRRFEHALQVFEWMDDYIPEPSSEIDAAIRIQLICRVHGVDHAEKYFNNLHPDLKGPSPYGALLGSFVSSRCIKKAECLFQEMKKLSFLVNAFSYNMMIVLYSQSGNLDKIDSILWEMESAGIPCNPNTLKDHMAGCVNASNTDAMAKILYRIRMDPSLASWGVYTMAARGYLKLNMKDSALQALKQAEYKLPKIGWFIAISHIMSLYAYAGSREDVYRVWEVRFERKFRKDAVYGIMISSLLTLDDWEGAERVFWEWDEMQSEDAPYNFKVLKSLISGYCKKRLPHMAEVVLSKVGRTPHVWCWNLLACGYIDMNEMGKGVEMLKKAMEPGRESFRPRIWMLRKCLNYLEGTRNVEEMEDFLGCVQRTRPLNDEIYGYLLRVNLAAGRSVARVLERMERDGVKVSKETRRIIAAA